ncbi:MAG: hypothetical protein EZS28_007019 [Streblomastix strix]|uniref:Uncharacterized protein n=1 Tax=Streblomastix strix TaxID=222440 RepID=A0A5J4WSR2_9EUKA|nr:MAG: hypothetical protein EZS28_007019 [Streblomastix strix]
MQNLVLYNAGRDSCRLWGLQAIWSNKVILLNPPLTLIGKVVLKICIVSNCTAVTIAMDWPNQLWTQQLQIMASNQIIQGNSDRIFKKDIQ